MIAANFTASFLLIAEGLWLGCLLLGKWAGCCDKAHLVSDLPRRLLERLKPALESRTPATASAST